MRTIIVFLFVVIFSTSVLVTSAQDDDSMLPDVIEFEQPGILPEGVVWDATHDRFLVGSLTQGTIFAVTDDGTITPFIEDADLVSTVGIHIDEMQNRLLVTNSNAAVFSGNVPEGPLTRLAAYDLDTGERLFMADMTGLSGAPSGFANDVTIDGHGMAYVTDSFAPVIYIVDTMGESAIFVQDEMLAPAPDAFFPIGLNGIDYHPDGYLLAAVTGSGSIVKIPLDDPAGMTVVEIDTPVLIDGMVYASDGHVIAVGSVPNLEGEPSQNLVHIDSEDEWASGEITNMLETGGAATTLTERGEGDFFAVNAHLQDPTREVYEIVRFRFSSGEDEHDHEEDGDGEDHDDDGDEHDDDGDGDD